MQHLSTTAQADHPHPRDNQCLVSAQYVTKDCIQVSSLVTVMAPLDCHMWTNGHYVCGNLLILQ